MMSFEKFPGVVDGDYSSVHLSTSSHRFNVDALVAAHKSCKPSFAI